MRLKFISWLLAIIVTAIAVYVRLNIFAYLLKTV